MRTTKKCLLAFTVEDNQDMIETLEQIVAQIRKGSIAGIYTPYDLYSQVYITDDSDRTQKAPGLPKQPGKGYRSIADNLTATELEAQDIMQFIQDITKK